MPLAIGQYTIPPLGKLDNPVFQLHGLIIMRAHVLRQGIEQGGQSGSDTLSMTRARDATSMFPIMYQSGMWTVS